MIRDFLNKGSEDIFNGKNTKKHENSYRYLYGLLPLENSIS